MVIDIKAISGSDKSAHQSVTADDILVGEIWREQLRVLVGKPTDLTRFAMKWRWFAKRHGESVPLGRYTRAAMLLGPGFKTKDAAIDALLRASDASSAQESIA